MERTSNHVRVIGSVCIVLSLLLLFANWLVPADDEDLITELMEDFIEMELFAGSSYDRSIAPIADCFADGKLSPVEGFTISRNIIKFLDYITAYIGSFDGASTMRQTAGLFATLYTILFAAVVISGIWTLFRRANGKRGGPEGWFSVSQIVLLLFVWVVDVICDGEIISLSFRVAWLTALGSVALAAPASVLERLPLERINLSFLENIRIKDTVKSITVKVSETVHEQGRSGPWTCPTCGNMNPADKRVCVNCGRAAADKKFACPGCGCMVDSDSAFCEHCGRKLR